MARYGMVIDLEVCVGCHACTIACKAANGTPPGVHFASVMEHEVGEYPNARREFLPVLCNHCDDAPCVDVCPTGASYQRADGIVGVKHDICIGCRACDTACPYGHRHYIEPGLLQRGYFDGDLTTYEKVKYGRWSEGTVAKCDFCMQRTDKGLQPACVTTCPPVARHFGDLSDPDSNVNRLLRERDSFVLLPDGGTKPRVQYLKPRSEGRLMAARTGESGQRSTAAWTAAGEGRKGFSPGIRFPPHTGAFEALSFLGEGAGGALYVLAVAAGLLLPAVFGMLLVGLAVVALLAHLGKPMRSWRAISKPGTSWVSRGTLAIGGFMGVAGLSVMAAWLPILTPLRSGATLVALVLALGVAAYGGMLLRSLRAIRFWRGPFLPLAFAAQGFATASVLMLGLIWWFAESNAGLSWLPQLALACVLLSIVFAAAHWQFAEASAGVQASKERLLAGDLRDLFVWGAGVSGLFIPAIGLAVILAVADTGSGFANAVLATIVVCRVLGDYAYRYAVIRAGAYEPMSPFA